MPDVEGTFNEGEHRLSRQSSSQRELSAIGGDMSPGHAPSSAAASASFSAESHQDSEEVFTFSLSRGAIEQHMRLHSDPAGMHEPGVDELSRISSSGSERDTNET
ncbi:unnamed protein product, partial [Chrysoparadoxa australica]